MLDHEIKQTMLCDFKSADGVDLCGLHKILARLVISKLATSSMADFSFEEKKPEAAILDTLSWEHKGTYF